METKELTVEEVERQFSAAIDSVNLIKGDKPEALTEEEWADVIDRNIEHLVIMCGKEYFSADQIEALTV